MGAFSMSQGEFVAELETGSLQRRDPDGPMAGRRHCDGCETLTVMRARPGAGGGRAVRHPARLCLLSF